MHYILHTSPLETRLQYLGLNQKNAESLAPLSFSQHVALRFLVAKCELRDVIHSLAGANDRYPVSTRDSSTVGASYYFSRIVDSLVASFDLIGY